MNDIKEKLRKEIKLREEIERQKDESIGLEELRESFRDITRVQAPDPWPDPPKENEEKGSNE